MLSKLIVSFKFSIRICIHFTSRIEALNEIYLFFSREVTHSDSRIRNSTAPASGMKLQTLRYNYDHHPEKSYLGGGGGREVFSFSNFPWDTLYNFYKYINNIKINKLQLVLKNTLSYKISFKVFEY